MQPDPNRRLVRTNTPGVFKRGERFVVVWKHDGKQHKSYHRTLSEAKRAKAQRASGNTTPPSRQRFDEYARAWVMTTRGRTYKGLSDSTRTSYADAIEFAIPHFGSKRLGEVKPSDIVAYIDLLAARGLKPASVRRYVAPIKALFATAVEQDVISRNPAGVRVIVAGPPPTGPRSLSPDEYRRLLAEIPDHYRPFVEFLTQTGARIGEAVTATWGDLNGAAWHIPRSKTPKGVRDVQLTANMARDLTRRRTKTEFNSDADPIWTTPTGTPILTSNFRKVFRAATKRAGIEGVTPHKLRHTFATRAKEVGWTDLAISAHLGHADSVITHRFYFGEVERGDVSAVAERLG